MMLKYEMIAVVGPTASGKSALAMELARLLNGEIICADSRTIYKGLNIGTAKPSHDDRQAIRHYMLDVVSIDQKFSVAEFKNLATQAINDIKARGKVPIIVGGSGLYVDGLIYDYDFGGFGPDEDLNNLSLDELQRMATSRGLKPSEQTWTNARHLAGFIRRGGKSGSAKHSSRTLLLGVTADKDKLKQRISQRVEQMFNSGLDSEVKTLLGEYPADSPGFSTPGYPVVIDYINGQLKLNEAKEQFKTNDNRLAKRQMKWFLRNKDIQWVRPDIGVEQIINENIR